MKRFASLQRGGRPQQQIYKYKYKKEIQKEIQIQMQKEIQIQIQKEIQIQGGVK